MGLGFWVFALGIITLAGVHLINPLWILLGYVFLTTAELLISPIGYSMVGRLSPEGKEGILMGVWTLFIGFGAIISSYLANLTTTKNKANKLSLA